MSKDHEFNPVAEIPEAALKQAAEDWGKKTPAEMRQESERLNQELLQINKDGGLSSSVLGGETASTEDRMEALTQRVAVKHYLTQTLAEMDAKERQLKAMVANMGGGTEGDRDQLEQRLDIDPLGYERDRGLVQLQRDPDMFGEFLAHAVEQVPALAELQRDYQSLDESPLVQALRQGLTLPMAYATRAELSHVAVTTSAGVTAERAPDRRRVDLPIRNPELLDYIPMEQEQRAIYTYIEETRLSGADGQTDAAKVRGSNQAATGEGQVSTNEAEFRDVRREVTIPMIEVNVPATYEQLMNTMRARRIIESKLPMMIDRVVDKRAIDALIALSGANEIVMAATGASSARVVTNAADQVLRALIEEVFAKGRTDANLCIFSPGFYVRFLTEQSSAGGYLIRSSSELSPVRTAWGCPVALVTHGLDYGGDSNIAAIVGDFVNYSVLAYAEQSGFRVLDQHGTEALAMTYRFQAWWRAIVAYLRPQAFCRLKIADA